MLSWRTHSFQYIPKRILRQSRRSLSGYETSANQNLKFKFILDYQIEIAKIIEIGFKKSPTKDLYFLTDYQFGPETGKIQEINIHDFWIQHDKIGLEWNILYKLTQ